MSDVSGEDVQFSLVYKGNSESLFSINVLLFLSNESISFFFVFFLVSVVEFFMKSKFEFLELIILLIGENQSVQENVNVNNTK